jgi:hypothetical protein
MRKIITLGIAAALVSGGIAIAAQQGAAAKKFMFKHPPSGNKKWVFLSKNTTATVQGNPQTNGASVRVALTPGGTQCLSMPAGANWSPISTIGYKYKDPDLVNGPVKVAIIKKTPSGNFILKVLAKGAALSPTLAAGTQTSYGVNFKINSGGDEYCASTGTAIPTKNDTKTFLVKNDTGTVCTASACSSPSGAFVDASLAF